MKKSNAATYVIFALLLVAANFYVSWQIFLPKYQKSKSEIKQSNEEISAARSKLESLKTAHGSLNELGSVVDQFLAAVPDSVDTPNLITELEALAAKHKTIIPAVQIEDSSAATAATTATAATSTASSPNAVPVTFSINGDYDSLTQFLTSVEKDIRFMNIKSVTFSSGDEGKMSLSLQLEAYKRSDTSLSGSVSSATAAGQSAGGEGQ